MGWADDALGVDMFWYEKLLIFIMYLERLALLTMYTIPWPYFFLENSRYLFVFLLDFTAHHGGVSALGEGTLFDGCDATCKSVWGILATVVIVAWALVSSWERFSLYYTVNVERLLWGTIQIFFLPFCNVLLRYYMLNKEGRLYGDSTWSTPLSELGVVLLVVLSCCFFGIGYARMSRLVLFISPIRHESYLRSREIEYLLHFSPTYRNERVWMISHFTLQAWWWSLARCGADLALLLFMTLASESVAIVLAVILLAVEILAMMFVVKVHRCVSSNWLEIVANTALFVYALLGVLQVFGVENAILVDSVLAWLILGIEVGSIGLCLLMCLWFFVDGHTFKFVVTVAEQRAARKWERYFSPDAMHQQEESQLLTSMRRDIAIAKDEKLAGKSDYNPYGLEESAIHLHSSSVGREEEDFIKALRRIDAVKLSDQMKAREADLEHSLSSTERDSRRAAESLEDKWIGIDAASPHTWPMNESIVNEMMRRNSTDHLVDYLRAARKLLDRISILHNSPMLVPTDEIKMHVGRLERSVQLCKLERITHHANIIHPLQPTFEELIEQLTYELRIFSKKSVTRGHNARKMIEVSRFLRIKMDQREKNLALLSPQMRRILLKMFALRIFIELVFDRKESLLPKKYNAGDELRKQQRRDERKRRKRRAKRQQQQQQRPSGAAADAFYRDSDDDEYDSADDGDSSSDDDSQNNDDEADLRAKLHAYDDPFAPEAGENFGGGIDVIDAFRRGDDDDLNNQQDDLDMTHQMQLAELLAKKKNRASSSVNGNKGPISAYDRTNVAGAQRHDGSNLANESGDVSQHTSRRRATTLMTGAPSAAPAAAYDDVDDDANQFSSKKNR